MKKIIRSSQSIEADFVVKSPFNNISIEILPTNKIKIQHGRHIEQLTCKSSDDIPETIYNYLKQIV